LPCHDFLQTISACSDESYSAHHAPIIRDVALLRKRIKFDLIYVRYGWYIKPMKIGFALKPSVQIYNSKVHSHTFCVYEDEALKHCEISSGISYLKVELNIYFVTIVVNVRND
jgi:hypothetical protein